MSLLDFILFFIVMLPCFTVYDKNGQVRLEFGGLLCYLLTLIFNCFYED